MTEVTAVATKAWLKWSWVHMMAHVEEFSSLDEAIAAACYASDAGEEAYECIETPDGAIIDKARMSELMSAHFAREWERVAKNSQPEPTYAIKLQMPGQKDAAWYDTYITEGERDRAAEVLRRRFGDRVRVGRTPWPTPLRDEH